MPPAEVAAILRQFNEWRRGDEDIPQFDPREIGEAIDAAIAMIDRLEAMEKDIALKERIIDSLGSELNAVSNERDTLRAKIEAMERQEPVAFALYSGWARKAVYLSEIEACEQRDRRQLTADLGGSLEAYRVAPLYLAPGAQPAPSALAEAIIADMQAQHDSELITENDSGEALIRLDGAIAAVEDNFAQPAPSVPEGWKLVPIEPTPEAK